MAQLTGGSETRHPPGPSLSFSAMATPTSKATPAKLAKRMSGRWRVVLLRAKGEILGTVEAPDAQAAKVAAVRSLDRSHLGQTYTSRRPPGVSRPMACT